MKFLIDANLPPALAAWLREYGHEAVHCFDLDMRAADDLTLWHVAVERGLIVISKDVDFVYLATSRADGPQIVWVRRGNLTLAPFRNWFFARWPAIESLLASDNHLVEVQ